MPVEFVVVQNVNQAVVLKRGLYVWFRTINETKTVASKALVMTKHGALRNRLI